MKNYKLWVFIYIVFLVIYILNLFSSSRLQKIDFCTLCFNDEIELKLLKLQAISFRYVDYKIINNVIIFYNDNGIDKINYIIKFYPIEIRHKVKIIYRDNFIKLNKSNWRNQQLLKLLLCKIVSTKHYIVLDSKNHFIRNVYYHNFFKDNKPILYLSHPGSMIKYYKNCLKYFNIKCPFNYDTNKFWENRKLITTTPFVFITNEVRNLIKYIEKREKKLFSKFFLNNYNITEFYFYSTYLIFTKKIKKCSFMNDIKVCIYNNPNAWWNTYNRKKHVVTEQNWKIFGLHRGAIRRMDNNYKRNLITLYKNFFDNNTVMFIKNDLLNLY